MKKWISIGITTLVLGGGGLVYGNSLVNPYTDKTTFYELELTSDIPQGERIEISKDSAQADMVFWNDEERVSIKPQIPTTLLGGAGDFEVTASRPLLSNKVEYKVGDVTAFIQPKSDDEFDIDFMLDKKPSTNVFTYKIGGADNFDFFYQPELTAEEIAEGANRPDNVVGSYAVYHKTKANYCTNCGTANYATGKAFHIYRPKAIDANGKEEWAVLDYKNGVLSVAVSQKFLDGAVYPVRIDPTFGYTTQGATELGLAASQIACTLYQSNVSGTSLDSMTAYIKSQNQKFIIASRASANNGTILANGITAPIAGGASGGWKTSNFTTPPTISTSTNYFLCDIGDATVWSIWHDFNPTPGVEGMIPANNYTTPTNPSGAQTNRKLSIYATYTATAAATSGGGGGIIMWEE